MIEDYTEGSVTGTYTATEDNENMMTHDTI